MNEITDRERDVLRQALHEFLSPPMSIEEETVSSREYLGDMPWGIAEGSALDLLARLSYARA